MRLSLRQYLARKLFNKKKQLVVGISFARESVSLCVLTQDNSRIKWTHDTEFGHKDWASDLKVFIKENDLSGAKCYVSLSSYYYQFLQLDKPAVPAEELHAALAFPIQEMLGANEALCYDFTDQVIQVSGQNKLSVIAVPEKDITEISATIFNANLALVNIGIEELASVELTPLQDDSILTLVQETGEEIVLNIVRNKSLYFTRRIKGFENLGSYTQKELDMGLIDNLCVQLQRSMDFFESQLRQAPVKKVIIKLDTMLQQHIAEQVSVAMDINVTLFEPDIMLRDDLNFRMASFSCIGAAYQHYRSSLNNTAIPMHEGAIS